MSDKRCKETDMKPMLKLILLPGLLLLSGCNDIELNSNWNNSTMVVDGELTEWNEDLLAPPKEPVAFAVRNDSDYLYLALRTFDPELMRQIVMTGLTVWLDPDGDRDKVLGIGYPHPGRWEPPGSIRLKRGADPAAQIEQLRLRLAAQTEIAITDAEGRVTRLGLENTGGIQAATSLTSGLQYELKIPLTENAERPFALAASPGMRIGIGLTTPQLERPARSDGRSGGGHGGMPGGGRGGKGGRSDRGGRGAPGGDHPDRTSIPEPLEIWLEVQLAEPEPRL